jgi:branched-chain amino acid transport system ATP-binding protein
MLLVVSGLVSGYDGGRVIDDVAFEIAAGETVALLGRNGVGKTTLLESVMGMVRASAGSVEVGGVELRGRAPSAASRAGVAIVPQGRRIFAPLTVEENLRIAIRKGGDWSMSDVLALMPRLAERRRHLGSQLSGGEQQMLSIGRALLSSPRLLLLDEPSDGLAPAVVQQVGTVIRELSERGLAMLIVEQDLRLAFDVSDRVLVMAKGAIVHRDTTVGFRRDGARARELLGLG